MAKRSPAWTAEQAASVLADCEASGQTVTGYCRQRDIDPKRLWRWRGRLNKDAAKSDGMPRFVELVPRPQPPSPARLRIHCPSGHQLEVEQVELLAGLRAALFAIAELSAC